MRFNKILVKTSLASRKNEFRKILMTYLGLTSTDVDQFFDIRKSTLELPPYRIKNNCLICQKYNVNVDSLEKLHYLMKLQNYSLEHRIRVFKEIGVPVIKVSLLNNMFHYLHKTVSNFKERTNIPAEENIVANIFGGKVPENNILLRKLNDELKVEEYYQICLLHCKNELLNLSYLDDKILIQKYLKVKSIGMIEETLKVLRNDLNYDDKMIKKNPSVIIASPDNIKTLISFPEILGMPSVTFLRKYPFILLQDAGNTKRLLMTFKQYKIPDKMVKNYINIFLLKNETFITRIEMVKHHPELNLWYMHKRMLQIIYEIKKTKHRMGYVDIMDSSKWANPQSFLSTTERLEKSVQTGITSHKHYLRHILMKELGVDLSDSLTRHQHWKTAAAFHDIFKMLKYLKMNFTINEICPNIHIVFYEQSKVEKVLADLKQQYSQSTKYSFTNSQYLALCLYIMEKDYQFTGNGVWSNEGKQQSSKEQNTIEKSYLDNI